MIENPGFIIKINDSFETSDNISLCGFVNKLPNEYGPEIIMNAEKKWEWLFFKPNSDHFLLQHFYLDDGENFILFCGSIYNIEFSDNKNALKERLLKLLNNYSAFLISEFINSISGYFCGIIGSLRVNKFIAFTDKYGVAKLFYLVNNSQKIFSTNLFIIKEYLGDKAEFSNFAFSSIVYCSHTFTDQSIIKNVNQILPGHFISGSINSNGIVQTDYLSYPQRSNTSLKDSVDIVAEAHKIFIRKINRYVENNLTLLLSRGKDCRVILKYLLDGNLLQNIITYYRKNNSLYPFVSFQLNNEDDSTIAEQICVHNKLLYNKIKIQNDSFLENMIDILLLNHGSPTHWEIFKAAESASTISKYLMTGFSGDFLAGKNLHNYRLSKIKNHSVYGHLTFNETSDINSYKLLFTIINKNDKIKLSPVEDLLLSWIEQYKSINTDDLDIIGWQGTVRTRSIGRIVPTFQQARLFTIPIYPYLDNDIINSYLTIPSKFLKGELAHLMQISEDKRFNKFQTTRFPIKAKYERKYLKIMSILRIMESYKSNFDKNKKIQSSNLNPVYNVLRMTLTDNNMLSEKLVNEILPLNERLPNEYYKLIANLVSAFRIKNVFFNYKINTRKNLSFKKYKSLSPKYILN
ncbi:MAG: hypothetical protein M1480_18525 [Bacteroidetes bacterium]|nr:hypothetical protein [Bacteroidota bacterium]